MLVDDGLFVHCTVAPAMTNLRNLTEKEYFAYLEDRGHVLVRRDDGSIDDWAFGFDIHNGVECQKCEDTWCVHCRLKSDQCEGTGAT